MRNTFLLWSLDDTDKTLGKLGVELRLCRSHLFILATVIYMIIVPTWPGNEGKCISKYRSIVPYRDKNLIFGRSILIVHLRYAITDPQP